MFYMVKIYFQGDKFFFVHQQVGNYDLQPDRPMQTAQGPTTITQLRKKSLTPELHPVGAGYIEVWKPKIGKDTEADRRYINPPS